jgi:hypothetical protein
LNLFPFPPARDADASVSRIALIRNSAEIERLAGGISKRQNSRQALAVELEKLPEAERDREQALDRDARTLLNRLADGLGSALASFGRQAAAIDERISISRHGATVAQRALSTLDGEIAALEAQMAELQTVQPDLVAASVSEAAQPIIDEFQDALDRMRNCICYLGGLERFLNIPRVGRLVATAPDFSSIDGFDTQSIAAPRREVEKARAAFAAYAALLANDPRAPVDKLVLPEVDPAPDDDLVYSDMTPIERKRADAAFVPPETRQRATQDSIALAESIAGAIEEFNSRTA